MPFERQAVVINLGRITRTEGMTDAIYRNIVWKRLTERMRQQLFYAGEQQIRKYRIGEVHVELPSTAWALIEPVDTPPFV